MPSRFDLRFDPSFFISHATNHQLFPDKVVFQRMISRKHRHSPCESDSRQETLLLSLAIRVLTPSMVFQTHVRIMKKNHEKKSIKTLATRYRAPHGVTRSCVHNRSTLARAQPVPTCSTQRSHAIDCCHHRGRCSTRKMIPNLMMRCVSCDCGVWSVCEDSVGSKERGVKCLVDMRCVPFTFTRTVSPRH